MSRMPDVFCEREKDGNTSGVFGKAFFVRSAAGM